MSTKAKRKPQRAADQVNLAVSMPKEMCESIDNEAKRRGLYNRSAYIRTLIARERKAVYGGDET